VTLYRINGGEVCILAAVCAMGEVEYNFSIEAEKDSTIYMISPEVFRELFSRSEAFKKYVFNALAQKLIMSMETIEMLIFISIEERIMEYLKQNADDRGEVKTTHEKMAIDLGSSREVITRQLKKMAEKGMIRLGRGKIILN
jgi:CRP/FNR family transcriptional regulator